VWPVSEVETALRRGYELRSVEVKGPCSPSDPHDFGRVARAVLAMSNIIDGGRVIIGIDERAMAAMLPGLTPDQTRAWANHDRVRDLIAKYADPPLAVESFAHQLSSKAAVVVLEIPGLAGMPHFCSGGLQTRDNRGLILRKGALYVRTIHRPQSVEVSGTAEMNEILDAAVVARLRAFVQTSQRAGITLGITDSDKARREAEANFFERQRRAGWEQDG
jgi:predicted HTH transcriptional regulator